MRRSSRNILLLMALCAMHWRGSVQAAIETSAFITSRGTGMGGAYSTMVDDASAGIVNPAALGFMATGTNSPADNNGLGEQRGGWSVLELGASGTLTGDLGDYLQTLANTEFSDFDLGNLSVPNNVNRLLGLAGALSTIGDQDTIVVNADAGSMFQIGHFAVGVRTFGQVGGWIDDLDLVNLGLGYASEQIGNELRQAIADEGFDSTGYTLKYLDGDGYQQLIKAFGGSSTNNDVVNYIDHRIDQAVQENGLDPNHVKAATATLAGIIESSDLNLNLTDNNTSITGRGFFALEIPVSYGHAFNDNFAVGLTAKMIFGRVYGTQVWAFNDDNEDILQDTLDSYTERVNVGLDLAMMYRIPKWQFALTGQNLNRPRFEGYDQSVDINGAPQIVHVPDVVLDPQISAGAAWIPVRRLALSTEMNMLETSTLLNGYDVQLMSLGTELDLSLVALRLGTYRNIAESDLGWVLTAGLGFNLWAVSFDVAGAMSIDDTVIYDGTEYPRTLRLNAGLSMNF
jgi:hypothetical protein